MQISGVGSSSSAYQTKDNSVDSQVRSLQSTKQQYLSQKLQIQSNEDLKADEKTKQVSEIDEKISQIDQQIAKLQSQNKSSSSKVTEKPKKDKNESEAVDGVVVDKSLLELIKKNREKEKQEENQI